MTRTYGRREQPASGPFSPPTGVAGIPAHAHRAWSLATVAMSRFALAALLLVACSPAAPEERYGFITRLGRDTIAVESVTRRGSTVAIDAVDRFPRVRRRHAEIELGADGSIDHLVMDIHTPSEPVKQRERHVVADVSDESVRLTKTDGTGEVSRTFAKQGGTAMAHVPQMYSLYELYLAAALRRRGASKRTGDTIQMRQFYLDREFDRFPLHRGVVRPLADGRAEIAHDWLAGTGEATLDSSYRLLRYSGARTTYHVDVERLAAPPDVQALAIQFEALEAKNGGFRQLSVRDTVRASIGNAAFTIDYSRPLARGRTLLGGIVPYDRVWRTGANAATQFTTSAPITLAGIAVPAGTYTLWTIPRTNEAGLIVNRQTGQWGTGYDPARDLGRGSMATEMRATPVEAFTISIVPKDDRTGTLAMEWGPFRWTAPIAVR
jgi:hypothetical protein